MEFKGTGKNWKLIGSQIWNKDGFPIIIGSVYKHNPNNMSYEEQSANALIISKAPEMLEMLKKILKNVEGSGVEIGAINLEEIEKLIKQATRL